MMLAILPFLCKFDINDGHCVFIDQKPAVERVFLCPQKLNFQARFGGPFLFPSYERTHSNSEGAKCPNLYPGLLSLVAH